MTHFTELDVAPLKLTVSVVETTPDSVASMLERIASEIRMGNHSGFDFKEHDLTNCHFAYTLVPDDGIML